MTGRVAVDQNDPPPRDRAENLLRVALAGGRAARWSATRCPRLMQTRILAQARPVFKHQDRPLGAGFFFSRGPV